jgi:hypothetical protein
MAYMAVLRPRMSQEAQKAQKRMRGSEEDPQGKSAQCSEEEGEAEGEGEGDVEGGGDVPEGSLEIFRSQIYAKDFLSFEEYTKHRHDTIVSTTSS